MDYASTARVGKAKNYSPTFGSRSFKGGEANQEQGKPEMKGWLAKWMNYLKGYQKRWFVLSNGLLSYYRSQDEMGHICRGSISLVSTVIHTKGSCGFAISIGSAQTFYLRACNEIERLKWVTALQQHSKARVVRMMESEEGDGLGMPSQLDERELLTVLQLLHVKLEDLSMCSELIGKHGAALQRSLSELEQLDAAGGVPPPHELAGRVRAVNKRAAHFRITTTGMMNACSEYVQLAQSQGRQWMRMLKHERQQCLCLQEMVEQLAKELSFLKRAARMPSGGSAIGADCPDDEDDNEQKQHYDKWTDSQEDKQLDTPWLLEKSELLTGQRKLHNRLNALVKRSELSGQAWGTPPEFLLRP